MQQLLPVVRPQPTEHIVQDKSHGCNAQATVFKFVREHMLGVAGRKPQLLDVLDFSCSQSCFLTMKEVGLARTIRSN